MKVALAIAGILALSITPTASFANHIEPIISEIRPGGFLAHTNLSGANLMGTFLEGAHMGVITATNIRGCPSSLPTGWVCENNSLLQR